MKLYQVDAFTDKLFGGNPAAVVPLNNWPDDSLLQSIALENNLSETAFLLRQGENQSNRYELRWFTPLSEVAMCGHATLAAAHVVFEHLGFTGELIEFSTRKSGVLKVARADNNRLQMEFPSIELTECEDASLVATALGIAPEQLFIGHYSANEFDYLAVLASQSQVEQLVPNINEFAVLGSRGVIASAPGEACDFVSRYFAPDFGITEDPVTGSAHCLMAPYWASKLQKNQLHAHQLSARGGVLYCEVEESRGRTNISGSCVDYLVGEITL